MKFQRIFTLFLVIADICMVKGLPRNVNGKQLFLKKAPEKNLSSKAGLIPQRFCTHQNCRNCHQGINTIFSKPSSSNRVCKLLITSPKCCFDYMWNTGQFFWANLTIFNQTANADTIYFLYFIINLTIYQIQYSSIFILIINRLWLWSHYHWKKYLCVRCGQNQPPGGYESFFKIRRFGGYFWKLDGQKLKLSCVQTI